MWPSVPGPRSYFQREVELPFFLHHLKGAPDPRLPRAMVFQTGSNRWERYRRVAPAGESSQQRAVLPGRKGSSVPRRPRQPGRPDEFLSDPARPVPFFDGPSASDMPIEYMTADQRFVASIGRMS